MYSDDDLSNAVKQGIVPGPTADAFREFVEHQRKTVLQDEEHFRLVTSFNDIFVVIAAVLSLAALWTLGNLVHPLLGGFVVAAGSWLLAEYFTLKRRMALPSIVLLFACTGSVFGSIMASFFDANPESAMVPLLAFAAATLVAIAHWFRFHVPITVAVLTATAIGVIISAIAAVFPFSPELVKGLLFVAGIVVFLLALRWDRSDRERRTQRADIAFWLHLLAAPLLVHPIFSSLADSGIGMGLAIVTIALYALLAITSLIIDRRALMVSALSYVIYVFAAYLDSVGLVDVSTAIIGLVVGSGLLMLSVYWHPLRQRLLALLPDSWQGQLPQAN